MSLVSHKVTDGKGVVHDFPTRRKAQAAFPEYPSTLHYVGMEPVDRCIRGAMFPVFPLHAPVPRTC